MPYQVAYSILFTNYDPQDKTEQLIDVRLYDASSFTTEPIDQSFIDLEPSANPVQLSFLDTDENIFTPIRGRRAALSFLSAISLDINTFAKGADNNWIVTITAGATFIFKGFLVLDDLRMKFLPNPQEVLLDATDALATLSDVPLTEDDGTNISGMYSIIELVYLCLKKTGQELNIHVVQSIKRDGEAASDTFSKYYLDAKTFEKEMGKSEDCRTVLDKICSAFGMFVCQHDSEWWLYAIDDFRHTQYISDNYSGGGYVGSTLTSSDKVLSFLADAGTEVSLRRPAKSVTIEYRYEFPKETPCNVDFSRGDLVDDSNPLDKTYQIECWTLKEGAPGFSGTVDGTTARIHRIFNANGAEIERYITLTPRTTFETSSINDITYIESEPIPVEEKDKFTVSIDFRLTSTTTGLDDRRLMRAILKGDDGTWWILGIDGLGNPFWWNTAVWTMNTGEGTSEVDFGSDEWQQIVWESAPVPVSGLIYIWINQINQDNAADDNQDIQYSNLTFEYVPYINGSYRLYTGHEHTFSQAVAGYKPEVRKQVFIAEGIKRLFKGALHYFDTPNYILAQDFFNVRDGAGAGFQITSHGKLLANAYWNQYRDNMRKFDLTLRGLQTDSEDVPGLVDRFLINDVNISTTNRRFMAVSMSQNLRDSSWTAIVWEVYSLVRGYEWDEAKYTFKYLT